MPRGSPCGAPCSGWRRRSSLSKPPAHLLEIAGAVVDGDDVDWDEAGRALPDPGDRRLLEGIRIAQEGASGAGGTTTATRLRPSDGGRWLRLGVRLLLGWTAVLVAAALAVAAALPAGNPQVPRASVLLLLATLVGAAFLLVLRERRDPRALWLAGLFLTIAAGASRAYVGPLREAGPPLSALAVGVLPEAFFAFFVWGLVRDFPRRRGFARGRRFLRASLRAGAAAGLLLFGLNLALWLGGLLGLSPPAGLARSLGVGADSWLWPVVAVLALPAFVFALVRPAPVDATERARARWFLAGLAAGVAPLFLAVVADTVWPAFARLTDTPRGLLWSSWIIYGALLTIPIVSAYAVLAQRLLDVRTALHGAARLALARTTLGLATFAPTLLLARHLLRSSDRTVAELVADPATRALAALAALGVVLLAVAPRLLAWLEERWLGRMPDLTRAMTAFGAETLAAPDVRAVDLALDRLFRELAGAERSFLLLIDPATGAWRAERGGIAELAPGSALPRLAAASDRPIPLDPDAPASLFAWIGEGDRQWVLETGAALAVPLAGRGHDLAGLLAVGRSRSGAPHPPRVLDAAGLAASTVALSLERLGWAEAAGGRAASGREPAGECRRCGRIEPAPGGACRCGGALEPAALPYEVAGKFRAESVLGAGGMGVVYQARDLDLGRRVALKTLPRVGSAELLRMRREARSMAAVSHPHLATLYGLESWNGAPILVVELLTGGTLAERLDRPLPPPLALRVTAEIAAALAALHGHGFLHRDVKPGNIAFTTASTAGAAKLLDFGLAVLAGEAAGDEPAESRPAAALHQARQTRTDRIVGTLLYLSPEAARGESATVDRDLWALHVVLWEMLAGRHPLAGLGQDEALRRIARARLPAIATACPDCPAGVAALLDQGLAADPAGRPRTAQEVAERAAALARELERTADGPFLT